METTAQLKPASRDAGLDRTRILAFFLVVSVHFFIGTGFYDNPVQGEKMYIMTAIRTLSMSCVPLFMLITGFLTRNTATELSPRGYLAYCGKLRRHLLTYVIAALFVNCFLYLVSAQTDFFAVINNIFGFAQYGWYFEMYLGLFAIIPFLARLFGTLEKKEATVLVAVLLFLSAAPSVFNIFNIRAFPHILSGSEKFALIPDWWAEITYPLTYWALGAYLGKFVGIKKMSTFRVSLLLIISLILFTVFNIVCSGGGVFAWGKHNNWGGVENTVLSVLLFLLLNSIKGKPLGKKHASFLKLVSELTFGAYLVSYTFDRMFYTLLREAVPDVWDRFPFYPIAVVFVAVMSLVISFLIHLIVSAIIDGADGHREKRTAKKEEKATSVGL